MSQENVEIVQQGYMDVNAFMQGNLADGSLEHLLDPQIEWDWNLSAARPPGTPERVQGSGELLAFLERVRDEWSDVAVEPLEFIDGSDGRVLVCARQFRRLSEEAAVDTLDVFHLWTIRDGRVSRLEIFLDRADVLEAAGLRE
jgi:ketosteroid isomerase-like protein